MAEFNGIYEALWRPDEIGITQAKELIPWLENGLISLMKNKKASMKYEPDNGWGSYEGLLKFTKNYLEACIENPDLSVEVSR
jgi:hypothetical protein